MRDRHAAHFAQRCRRRAGSDGTDRAGATPSTGSRPSSATFAPAFQWSTQRGDLTVATDIAAHAALMGFLGRAVRDRRLGRGTIRRRGRPRPFRGCLASTPLPATPVSSGAPKRPQPMRIVPSSWSHMPGYESVRARLRDLRRGAGAGLLRSPRSLCRADRLGRRPALGSTRGYGLASYVDGLAGERPRRRGARAASTRRSRPRGTCGNPYWIAYALWIAGLALVEGRAEARAGDLGRGGRPCPRASGPLLRRVPCS